MHFGYWEVFPLQRKERFMKRQALAFVASLACAGALVAAQSAPPPPQTPADPQQKPQEISLTGCLTQGSAPNVFILENAKVKPEDQNEKGATFVLVASKAEMSFKPHLNHSVKVTGIAESKTVGAPAPAGEKPKEAALPKLTASAVTMVSDRCEP